MRGLVVLGVALAGCDAVFGADPPPPTTCSSDDDCTFGEAGVCDCGHCSYRDTACALSNRRWPKPAPGDLGDACVPLPEQIDARVFHTCMKMSDGTAWCWGSNFASQLGAGQPGAVNALYPVQVRDAGGAPLRDILEIRTGAGHTCARLGDRSVWCWGTNQYGQLGAGGAQPTGEGAASANPLQVVDASGAALGNVEQLSLGYVYACTIVGRHDIYCWGDNGDGELGISSTTIPILDHAESHIHFDEEVRVVASGGSHSCAIRNIADNTITSCWGQAGDGRLANGTTAMADIHEPTDAQWVSTIVEDIPNVIGVAAGNKHTCAIKFPDGEVYCWGLNNFGQGGVAGTSPLVHATKIDFVFAQDPSLVAIGADHSCMTVAADTWCWGRDDDGELGNAGTTTGQQSTPVRVNLDVPVRWLTAGHGHTCVIGDDLLVRCWGSNGFGQLGDGTTNSRHEPVVLDRESYCPSRANP